MDYIVQCRAMLGWEGIGRGSREWSKERDKYSLMMHLFILLYRKES